MTIHPLPLRPSTLKTHVEGGHSDRANKQISVVAAATTGMYLFAPHPYREQDSVQRWLMTENVANTTYCCQTTPVVPDQVATQQFAPPWCRTADRVV